MPTRASRALRHMCLIVLCSLAIAQTSAQPRQGEDTYYSFLPIIKTPLPPPATESRYLVVESMKRTEDYGCKQGKAMQQGQTSGVVVLLYGGPDYDSVTQSYGTALLDGVGTFTSTVAISQSAEHWVEGFLRCSPPGNIGMTLAIGTSNSELTPELAIPHAKAWAMMVNDLSDRVKEKGLGSRIRVVGASNIELNWSTPQAARTWVDSYNPEARTALYIVGDCSGCPSTFYPGWIPDNGWTLEDIWYISWGAYRSYPMPEIYNTRGVSASQWQFVARWGVDHRQKLMLFTAAFTQHQACKDHPEDPCTGRDNTPEQGWKQLWDALSKDPQTAQTPLSSTDVRWNY